jgi:hypothetical protein
VKMADMIDDINNAALQRDARHRRIYSTAMQAERLGNDSIQCAEQWIIGWFDIADWPVGQTFTLEPLPGPVRSYSLTLLRSALLLLHRT